MANFLVFLIYLFFCFVVAMSDLVHDVAAIDGLCKLLTVSGIFF